MQNIAMDMNASYNILFSEKLPKAVIVYDRYHMQAQYGKDVLGAVRLQEARKHQGEAKIILERAASQEAAVVVITDTSGWASAPSHTDPARWVTVQAGLRGK